MIRVFSYAAIVMIAGCIQIPGSTPPTSAPESKPLACIAYTTAQETAIAGALTALPPRSPLIGAMADYHNMRIANGCSGAE